MSDLYRLVLGTYAKVESTRSETLPSQSLHALACTAPAFNAPWYKGNLQTTLFGRGRRSRI